MSNPAPQSPNGTDPQDGRVLIIGLDGITFDLVEPWVKEGHLPNFARLMEQGAWGRLQTTVPAHSAPAWSTFSTGLMPGKHGVYFFLGPSRDERYFRPVSSKSIRGRRFWEVAGEQGKTVGVINVPLSYPLRPVNGYTIAGMFAPSDESAFSSKELYDEIQEQCGGYVVEADRNRNRATYLEDMMEGMRLRTKVTEYLMEHHPVDLTVVVYRMIDSIMHTFWADMDPGHPLRPSLGKEIIPNAMLDAYRLLDESVGRLIERAGPDTTVFILSDHGFRAEYRGFAVNKWLREKGLLTLRRGRGPATTMVAMAIRNLHLHHLAKRVLHRVKGQVWQEAVWGAVDWTQTQVVYGPGPAFYVNLQGRDKYGIVPPSEYEALRDRIIKEFKEVRDPTNGLPIVSDVYRREELYEGDAVELAPDLVPVPAEYVTADGHRWGYGLGPMMGAIQSWRTNERYAGAHSAEGVFIAAGPRVVPGRVEDYHIADLPTTALYALGVQVPNAMDGTVRTELFSPEYTQAHPVNYADIDMNLDGRSGRVMGAEEEEKVESRLKDLGYL